MLEASKYIGQCVQFEDKDEHYYMLLSNQDAIELAATILQAIDPGFSIVYRIRNEE